VIKALIFDFDGLIMDTESPEVEGWREIYASYDQEFPVDVWISQVVGASAANFDAAAHLATLTGLDLDIKAIHSRAHANRLHKQSLLSALPGVTETIQTAHSMNLRLAVASSSERDWVEGYLKQLDLFDDFETLICREDAPRVKPAPDIYLKALETLDLPSEQAVAFEDSPNGVKAARAAGLRVVAVPNPITVHGRIEGASLRLSSLAEYPLDVLLARLDS
jgi:HAD superfamily hydrolase (TIGR01509 family)